MITLRRFLVLLTITTSLLAEVVVDVDFTQPNLWHSVNAGRVSGVLPSGILEDSAWADIAVAYQPQEDLTGGGSHWIRAEMSDRKRGRAQLKMPLSPHQGTDLLTVRLAAASQQEQTVRVLVARNGAPYTTHWEQQIVLQPTVQEHVLSTPFTWPEHPVALIIALGTTGSIDLHRLQVERLNQEAVIRDLEARHPNGGPANLLSTTHFPLGLPPGWSISNHLSYALDVEVRAQTEAPSPAGTIGLRLVTDGKRGPVNMWSPPVSLALPHRPHTLSFFVRGSMLQGRVRILSDGRELAAQDIPNPGGPQWQRVELCFQPEITGRWHVLHWTGTGNFAIDRLMVAPGEVATDWRRSLPTELTLTADPMRAHLFFSDEERYLQYAVSALDRPALLHLHATHLSGGEQSLPPVELAAGPPRTGSIAVDGLFPEQPLGSMRIVGTLRGSGGDDLAPAQEVVIHVVRRPRHWGEDAPQSAFGVHVNAHEPHLHAAKALGANWVRFHGSNGDATYWSALEPRPGEFTPNDARIGIYRSHHLSCLGVWTQCPKWARIARSQGGAWLDLWWQPRDLDEFARYVTFTTEHFRGVIDHWQIWNEPWGGFWFRDWDEQAVGDARWHPGPDPIGDYLALSQRAYTAAKTVNPDVTVVGVCGTYRGKGSGWIADLLQRDPETPCDVSSFHAYHSDYFGDPLASNSPWVNDLQQNVFRPLETSGRGASPIWVTEGKSSPDTADTGLYLLTAGEVRDDLTIVRRNCDRLAAYHLALMSKGVEKIFIYAMSASGQHFRPTAGIDWGVLTTKCNELHPSASAYAAFTWHLEGTRFVSRHEIVPGIHAFVFAAEADSAGGRRAVAAITAGPEPSSWTIPAAPGLVAHDFLGNLLPAGAPFPRTTVYLVLPDGTANELKRHLQ